MKKTTASAGFGLGSRRLLASASSFAVRELLPGLWPRALRASLRRTLGLCKDGTEVGSARGRFDFSRAPTCNFPSRVLFFFYLGPRGPLAGPSICLRLPPVVWAGGKRNKAEAIAAGPCPRAHSSRTAPARAAPVPPRALFARPCLSGERWRAVPPSRVPSAQHAQPHPAQGRGRLDRRGWGRNPPQRVAPGRALLLLRARGEERRGGPKEARGQNGGRCRFEPRNNAPHGGGATGPGRA